MEYKELSVIYHMDSSSSRQSENTALAEARIAAESTFDLGINTTVGRLFVAMPREMSLLYEKVLRAERKVSSMMRSIPPIAQAALIRGLVLDEVVSTNALEDVHSTRRQILDALSIKTSGDLKYRRFRELADLYLGLFSSQTPLPQKPEDIREIYDRVMDGELNAATVPDGKIFRAGGVDITSGGIKVIHQGVEPESAIITYMEQMLTLINRRDIPEVIAAFASHYIFEYTHPFYDGNGRTGRFLLSLFLSEALSAPTVLSLSRAITERKNAYYNAFKTVENPLNHGELTFFVYAMLELARTAQSTVLDNLSDSISQFNSMSEALPKLCETSNLAKCEKEVVYALAQYALFGILGTVTLDELATHIGLTKQTTRKYATKLEDKELIEATSRRPLAFQLSNKARSALAIPPAPQE